MLEDARRSLFREIADEYGLAIEQAQWVYEHLVQLGLIDYDVEKEILLYGDDEDEE